MLSKNHSNFRLIQISQIQTKDIASSNIFLQNLGISRWNGTITYLDLELKSN